MPAKKSALIVALGLGDVESVVKKRQTSIVGAAVGDRFSNYLHVFD
jgi:hypothetical protein